MRILQVLSTCDPELGGVPEAGLQMAFAFDALGLHPVTLTLDPPGSPWLKAIPGTVHALGPSRSGFSYNGRVSAWLDSNIGSYDAVVTHGIWQHNSLAVSLAARHHDIPYFVFTHGQLDPWFKRAFPLKHAKKWLYWPWGAYRVLRNADAVLFTTVAERDLARQSFWLYRCNEVVVGFGIRRPAGDAAGQRRLFLERFPETRGRHLLLFLSRIHAKKGCDLLVEAFAGAAQRDPRLHLVIAGPDESGAQRQLVERSHELGIAQRITWTGMLAGDMKWGAFRAADCFILPSHSENFGLVVAEALACGVPVLTTDKVNVWKEVVEESAGFVEQDSLEGTVKLLERWLECRPEKIAVMRQNAKSCFDKHFDITRTARNVIELGRQYAALAAGADPGNNVRKEQGIP